VSTTVLHRPARTPPPPAPTTPIEIAPPPPLPGTGQSSWVQYALPAVGSLGALVFVLANPRPLFVLGGLLFASTAICVGVALAVTQRSAARNRRFADRVRYLEHLGQVREAARTAAAAQGRRDAWSHPHPAALWQLTDDPFRLWERRRHDDDALVVRVGRGPARLPAPLRLGRTGGPLQEVDAVCRQAAEDVAHDCGTLADAVLTVALGGIPALSLVGPPERTRALARAVLAQAAAWHSPDDLRVAVVVGADCAATWTWVKWLPHCSHPEARDATSQARLYGDGEAVAELLLPELSARQTERGLPGPGRRRPHLLVVVDTGSARTGHAPLDVVLADAQGLDATVVTLTASRADEPSTVTARLTVQADGSLELDGPAGSGRGEADVLAVAEAEQLARRLLPAQLPAGARGSGRNSPDLVSALGIDPGSLDPAQSWAPRPDREVLRVPIGVTPEGSLVHLDLKESAVGGMGPHGLCVGATGSGKSELLRSLVVALAATHPPDVLTLLLVDFKGGATFAGLAELPHVAGMLTNLEDDLALVDRFSDALRGEMQRRQQLLRAAGNLASVREHQAARRAGADFAPLPSLFVVVDEFSELLSAKPDFAEDFVALGRLGRSLGMHLLLASQRLEEGRIRGLDSHLSYRIGLRTFSASDSRAVLGVPDAYELPREPGAAYLKVDTTVFQRLQATYVSAPYDAGARAEPVLADSDRLLPYTANNLALPPAGSAATFGGSSGLPSTLEVVVDRLRAAAPRAHQVWTPPLGDPPTLDALLPPLAADPERGLQAAGTRRGDLCATIGVVDRPRQQRRDPLVVDLSGAGGHLAVVGGPQSGKTTTLRTLITSLVLRHTPAELAVHAVDLGGGLTGLAGLPHVGTVATRHEPDVVRRLVGQVAASLVEREQLLRTLRLDGAQALRAAAAEGRLPDGVSSDLLLVIDGWGSFRSEFDDLEPMVQAIAARGLALGVHLVLAANRWFDVRPQIKDALGSRLELRIIDKGESELSRKEAGNVPAGRPGRGLVDDGVHVQVALPRVDGQATADGLGAATTELVESVRAAWPGPPVPPVRMLPLAVPVTALRDPSGQPGPGVPVGVGERDTRPVRVDLSGPDPHLLVLGDGGAGKTTFLRVLLDGLVTQHTPDQARVVLVDYRRTLLGAVPDSHLLAYVSSGLACEQVITDLAGSMHRRLPGVDVTPEQLRDRSWWSGPDVYLVVDDHDLVVTARSNPLAPLVEVLAQARDIGFHLVLTRRVGGASRAFFEPVLQRLRDLSTPGLLLSGDPAEGPLLGPHKAVEQPAGRGLLVSRGTAPQLVQVALPAPP
jgi:S-DNA-T family DNA segregation ATPase FtsK/SpoIIIE